MCLPLRTGPNSRMNLDEKLTVLLKHLPALRSEGVSCLEIEGIKVELRPITVELQSQAAEAVANRRDPTTFGLPPGALMPTLGGRRG